MAPAGLVAILATPAAVGTGSASDPALNCVSRFQNSMSLRITYVSSHDGGNGGSKTSQKNVRELHFDERSEG